MLVTLNEKVKKNIAEIIRPDLITDLLEMFIYSDDLSDVSIKREAKAYCEKSLEKHKRSLN